MATKALAVGKAKPVLTGRLKVVACLAVGMVALVILYACDPSGSRIFPPCLFHVLTGLYCPGCGSSRAIHQLLHGHLAAAFGLNAFAVISLPFLGYALASRALEETIGRGLPRVRVPILWISLLPAIIILFWVLRNIPVYPLTLLAP